jgi:hypothetical protein
MRYHLKPDPLGQPRNPLAIYLLLLAFFSGLTAMAGVAPPSIESELPPSVGFAWALMLTMGAGAMLAGVYWPGTIQTGLSLKKIGSFALSVAAMIYAVVLLVAFGFAAFFNAGIILGFGVACYLHYRTVSKRVQEIVQASR